MFFLNAADKIKKSYLSYKVARCSFFNKSSHLKLPVPVNECTFILDGTKVVYSRVPKAGNTTVVANLMKNEGIGFNGKNDIDRFKTSFTKLCDLSKREVDAVQDYYKFTIVRCPYERFESVYLDKMFKDKKRSQVVRDIMSVDPRDEISVDCFLDYLQYEGGISTDRHWIPQVDLMAFDIDDYDYIGNLENIEYDLREILASIYGSYKFIDKLAPHSRVSSLNLNEKQRQRVRLIYSDDFNAFGY